MSTKKGEIDPNKRPIFLSFIAPCAKSTRKRHATQTGSVTSEQIFLKYCISYGSWKSKRSLLLHVYLSFEFETA